MKTPATGTERTAADSRNLQQAQDTVQSFTNAFKSYSLYPEDHAFNRTNLEKFNSHLQTFLEQHEELSLGIRKNAFVYEGIPISEDQAEEANPGYLLTRDGIVRLTFQHGINIDEIRGFLGLLNRHRGQGDEAGGDIVTSLWQQALDHIEYEELDIFALESFNFDLGSLRVAPEGAPLEQPGLAPEARLESDGGTDNAAADEADGQQSVAQGETVTNLLQGNQSLQVLAISPEEQRLLQAYVEEEERKDYTSDIIDVLLVILISQKKGEHFGQVLDFLGTIFFDVMAKGEFHLSYKLCSNVLTIRNKITQIRPWAHEQVDEFLTSLSDLEQWAALSWVSKPHLLVLHRKHLKYLLQVLLLLLPEIIKPLCPFLGNLSVEDIDIRNELLGIIDEKAAKDPEKFAEALALADEGVNLLLFPLVERIGGREAENICLAMTRHESVGVRRAGLQGYLTYAPSPDPEALYPLLSDEDENIVSRVLEVILSLGDGELSENLLLRFLEQALSERLEHAHMIQLYKALSRCGSARTVKALKNILLESRLKEMFNDMNSLHKKGSALALKIIGSDEAMIILQKGAKSMRPDIRLACQFALEKVQ